MTARARKDYSLGHARLRAKQHALQGWLLHLRRRAQSTILARYTRVLRAAQYTVVYHNSFGFYRIHLCVGGCCNRNKWNEWNAWNEWNELRERNKGSDWTQGT